MMKVDKNMLERERCKTLFRIGFSEPLLFVFPLKGKSIKWIMRGLHLLCRKCRKFGHYIEDCLEKTLMT